MKKLGVFISHPIPYHILIYRELARVVDLRVFFYSRYGVEKYFDPQFKKEISWDVPLLEGYRHEFLPNRSPFKGFSFWGFVNLGIIKIVKQEKFDAVLLSSWSYFSDWVALLVCRWFRVPVIMRVENAYVHELSKPGWKVLLKKILFGRFVFPMVGAFCYIGSQNKKFLQWYGVPDSKLFFAPYCIDNTRFMKAYDDWHSRRRELRVKWHIPEDAVVIFSGGTKLSRKKRSFDLIKAFENILPETNTVLVLVGEGELKKEVRQYIQKKGIKNIIFTGFVGYSEMPLLYVLSDILVLPSGVGETWGVVVNEAMCCRLPVIVSDMVGSGDDLVRHGENGFIFPLGGIKELIGFIDMLVCDKEKRVEFGKRSFALIQKYDYSMVVNGINEALRSL